MEMTKEMTPVNVEARKSLDLRAGDTVRVYQKVEDKSGKVRIQAFEGLVLSRKHGVEPGATFTVRRVAGGYGVEKIFPLYSPMIDKIEIVKRSKVRRSKLYYIREKALKQISKRMKMMFVDIKSEEEVPADDNTSAEDNTDTNIENAPEENTTSGSQEADVAATETPATETPSEEEKPQEENK